MKLTRQCVPALPKHARVHEYYGLTNEDQQHKGTAEMQSNQEDCHGLLPIRESTEEWLKLMALKRKFQSRGNKKPELKAEVQ